LVKREIKITAETEAERSKKAKTPENFETSFLRGQKGIYGQLLAGNLIKSNQTSDPLIKVGAIVEAAQMSKQIDKLDPDFLLGVQRIYSSFYNASIQKEPIALSWPFVYDAGDYENYILAWHDEKMKIYYYPYQTNYRKRRYPGREQFIENKNLKTVNEAKVQLYDVIDRVKSEISDLPVWSQFIEKTSALTRQSYNDLLTEFVAWSLPQLSKVKLILSQEVTPQTWREVMGAGAENINPQQIPEAPEE
jgi:hypothetical protein